MPALTYNVEFELENRDLYDGDPQEVITATVYNDAHNERGFEYFEAVDSGRREVYPIQAKALHWEEFGEEFFRDHVAAAVPRELRKQALEAAAPRLALLIEGTPVSTRAELVDLVNECARVLENEVVKVTPIRTTGQLKSRYYTEDAV